MSFSLDDPPNSRLFVVAGRNTSVSPATWQMCVMARDGRLAAPHPSPSPLCLQSEFLRSVFEQYGQVSFVKYLRDKGEHHARGADGWGELPPEPSRRGEHQGPALMAWPGPGGLSCARGRPRSSTWSRHGAGYPPPEVVCPADGSD